MRTLNSFQLKRSACRDGFTLIELLVACAVLALIIVLLSQMVIMTGKVISFNAKKLDAAGQARLVFDRIATDLAGRPRRPEIGMVFSRGGGNDSFRFYSEVEGYNGARRLAAVDYRVQQTTPGRIFQLERGATGTDWNASPFVQTLPNTLGTLPDADYEVLADGVFRMEYCYLLDTGQMTTALPADFSHVVAVIVTLGILDGNSRRIVSNTQLQQLASSLPDTIEGKDPISGWNAVKAGGAFGAGLPQKAIENVRFYQRTFYVQ